MCVFQLYAILPIDIFSTRVECEYIFLLLIKVIDKNVMKAFSNKIRYIYRDIDKQIMLHSIFRDVPKCKGNTNITMYICKNGQVFVYLFWYWIGTVFDFMQKVQYNKMHFFKNVLSSDETALSTPKRWKNLKWSIKKKRSNRQRKDRKRHEMIAN